MNQHNQSMESSLREQKEATWGSVPSRDFMLCFYNTDIQPEALEMLIHAPEVSIVEYHSMETSAYLIRILFNASRKPETQVQALQQHHVSEAALTAFRCVNTPFPKVGQIYRLTTADGSRLLYFASFDLNCSRLIVEEERQATERERQS